MRDYVTVDFDSMAKVVDAMGGVTIDVQANEIKSTNESIKEYCKYYKETPTYVKKAGVQTLNGMQACGYSRVRYAGNGGRSPSAPTGSAASSSRFSTRP